MIGEKFLPIGTVVLLKTGTKRMMITGYCMASSEDPELVYDYAGCVFPEGFVLDNKVGLFDHDEIERVDYMGLADDEQKKFCSKLLEVVNSAEEAQ